MLTSAISLKKVRLPYWSINALLDSVPKRILLDILKKIPEARIRLVFWDGSETIFGERPELVIRFKKKEALKAVLTDLSLGFGEGYMNGDIIVEGDLNEVIRLAYLIESLVGPLLDRKKSILLAFQQRNTRGRDQQHIAHHYDLGDDFYRLWLDEKMMYSCAYFLTEEDPLEKAQQQKIDYCCRKLALRPNETLLDIGCGWGGLLLTAARDYGTYGLGVTLSRNQADTAHENVKRAGLADKVEIHYRDYRELPFPGRVFDKIVSVGMFEHVGKKNIKEFFTIVGKSLKPGGLFLLHTIGKVTTQVTDPWLKKYIFPGAYIPGLPEILNASMDCGLNFIDLEDLRIHYNLTLNQWRARFERNKDKIKEMFGERFVRMWRFYLCGCASSFRDGDMHLFQVLFSAGTVNSLPLTRNWMSLNPIPKT